MRRQFSTIVTLEKLKAIKTENFTINELHALINYKYSIDTFRSFLNVHKIQYKKKTR